MFWDHEDYSTCFLPSLSSQRMASTAACSAFGGGAFVSTKSRREVSRAWRCFVGMQYSKHHVYKQFLAKVFISLIVISLNERSANGQLLCVPGF